MQHAAGQSDVTFVRVENGQGKTLATAGIPGESGLVLSEPIPSSAGTEGKGLGVFDDAPAERPTGPGKVTLGMSLAGFQSRVRRVVLVFALVAVVLNVLALIPAFLISRWLATRVVRAAEGTRRVGTGDYSVRLAGGGTDEISDLERGFDAMTEALGDSRATLEAKVEELTHTLELLQKTRGQLLHADKIAAVGQLAGGVAHDFNNLLTAILFSGRSLEDSLGVDDPRHEDVSEIILAANRAAELTRQLLAFSRRQQVEPKVVDVNQSVKGMEKMLRRLIGENIQLVFETGTEPLTVLIDPGQLEQVVLNLVVNARDALPEGGSILVHAVRGAAPDGAGILPRPGGLGECAQISVTDNGVGMSEETRHRIFEPFFTTKGVGKGTGLGLSTVYGIVEQSGGQIVIASQLGSGTTFSIYFPVVPGDAPAAVRRAGVTQPASRRHTILLVEDEDRIRHITAKVLRKNGYEVIDTGSPVEALDLASSAKSSIQLLSWTSPCPRSTAWSWRRVWSYCFPSFRCSTCRVTPTTRSSRPLLPIHDISCPNPSRRMTFCARCATCREPAEGSG